MLTVENLTISFRTDEGLVTPVRDVSFDVPRGKTLGLVGESGSGKSVSTRAIMRLLPGSAIIAPESRITYVAKDGKDIDVSGLANRSKALRRLGLWIEKALLGRMPMYRAVKNLSQGLLGAKEDGVDVAFVLGGLKSLTQKGDLESLGSLFFEPLWIFPHPNNWASH